MTEQLNWDHTMIDVTDLQRAIDYFNSKGFDFRPGGRHKYWGTKNALDYFGLNYIELLTVADPTQARAFPYENNSGIYDAVRDYFAGIQRFATIAIRTTDIEATHRRLAAQGIDVGEITGGKRVDPSGKLIQWQIFYVNDKLAAGLPSPFFIQWGENDADRKVTLKKQGLIRSHSAGEIYVEQGIFKIADPQKAANQLAAMLQTTAQQQGQSYYINISGKQLVFVPGTDNRLVELIFAGAKHPEKLQLGEIKFDLRATSPNAF